MPRHLPMTDSTTPTNVAPKVHLLLAYQIPTGTRTSDTEESREGSRGSCPPPPKVNETRLSLKEQTESSQDVEYRRPETGGTLTDGQLSRRFVLNEETKGVRGARDYTEYEDPRYT